MVVPRQPHVVIRREGLQHYNDVFRELVLAQMRSMKSEDLANEDCFDPVSSLSRSTL